MPAGSGAVHPRAGLACCTICKQADASHPPSLDVVTPHPAHCCAQCMASPLGLTFCLTVARHSAGCPLHPDCQSRTGEAGTGCCWAGQRCAAAAVQLASTHVPAAGCAQGSSARTYTAQHFSSLLDTARLACLCSAQVPAAMPHGAAGGGGTAGECTTTPLSPAHAVAAYGRALQVTLAALLGCFAALHCQPARLPPTTHPSTPHDRRVLL